MEFSGIDLGIAAGVAARETANNYQAVIDGRDATIENWIRHTKRLKLRMEAERKFRAGWQQRAIALEGVALDKGEDVKELRAASDRYIAQHQDEIDQKIDAKTVEIEAKIFEELPRDQNGGY